MLDIILFRDPKTADVIRESQRRRFKDVSLVDAVIELDTKWRLGRTRLDRLKKVKNLTSKTNGKKRKSKEDPGAPDSQLPAIEHDLVDLGQEFMDALNIVQLGLLSSSVNTEIKRTEDEVARLENERNATISKIGNVLHESVPVSRDEEENEIIRTWGKHRGGEGEPEEKLMSHIDLMERIDGYDLKRGAMVAGSRGYYMKGALVRLHFALMQYGIEFLSKKGFVPIYTPFFMEQNIMGQVAQLEQFDEELYKVTGEGEPKYLIATSEQTLAAYHLGEWIDPRTLPLKYLGMSTCFRKEVGAHGRDTLGIFRVHQFEKLEQFVVTSPDASWEMFEEMMCNAEDFYKSLGIAYRIVSIVSGELNNAAAKKHDLEAWFPASGKYRELVSCSNCTDYQARRMEARFGLAASKDKAMKEYVHMLNSTLCATTRTLCCIVETCQQEDGIKVPDVLVPFMGGIDFIPYVKKIDTKK
eukprot:TRINITY_DN1260_c0_g1_i1.p1 TRINITY_DN1260_c0_g1~~TRINITY_DN1260_c0_g1_i1.p1  ORF type:complete len:470 (+),score=142.38 TRINITY_DN1260_c0_g1_i1:167-1576(+)